MSDGLIRHLFPGGNTPFGFHSYYNYIIPIDANRIFIMKGGPGTGKSTFMKKIGEAMVKQGYNVEFHHCSSDNNSLDGIVIPELKIAFIDGTAPHIVDPKNPGCVDEIIHLGDFWNEKRMVPNKQQVISCNKEIGLNFQRAYRYLSAAKSIYDDLSSIYTEALDMTQANKAGEELLEKILGDIKTVGNGKIRKLFASAITPDGAVNYLESSVWNMKKCYAIGGEPGSGKSTILQKIINAAVIKGLDIEVFYCPLAPEKPDHIVIPSLDTAITTSTEPHLCRIVKNASMTIDMNQHLNPEILTKYTDTIAYDQDMYHELFQRSVTCIKKAKTIHDELETYYVPHMDFQAVQDLWQKIFARVLSYSKPA